MGKLTERYPGIKRLQAAESDITHEHILRLVQPYLAWELVEIDTVSSDIVVQRPSKPGEPSQLDDLMVLVGQVAAVWLRSQPSSRGQ